MKFQRLRLAAGLVALLALAWALRAPFLSRQLWNLDEGVTLTIAEQIGHGDVLYRDAVDHRGPLVPYLQAAVYAVAGSWNGQAVHFALALALGACAFGLWRLARRLGDETTGIAGALAFTALSFLMLDKNDALSANNGWFVVLFSTAGFVAFAWALSRPAFGRAALAGALFGGAFLAKQPGLIDFGVTWVLLALLALDDPHRWWVYLRFWLGLLAGAAVPVLAFAIYFAAHGALADCVYYAITYNTRIYVPALPLAERLPAMADPFVLVWDGSPVLALLAGAGAAGMLFVVFRRTLRRTPGGFPVLPWLILGWAASGVVSTGLSGRHFSHYSAQAVPGFSLAAGWAVARVVEWVRRRSGVVRRIALGLALLAALAAVGFDYLQRARQLDRSDGLVVNVGRLVQAHSAKHERIFVWGYYPEIYYFARRLPATRFLYTNFVTGLVPWTNIDPFIDTSASVVPGTAAQLEADWRRRPPAVVVDTGSNRGYLKYPLDAQAVLWKRIRADYAEVSVAQSDRLSIRLFRRLRPPEPNPLAGNLREDPRILLSGFHSYRRNEPPRLRVTAPAGARRVELYAAGERIADLDQPVAPPVDVLFFADDPRPAGTDYRVVVTTAAGPVVSRPFDFGAYVRAVRAEKFAGPELQVDQVALRPLSVDTLGGKPVPHPQKPGFWKITSPIELEYRFPVGLRSVDFVHGLEVEAWGRSDGYDLVLEHRGDDGRRTVLFRQRLHALDSRADREAHPTHLELPPLGPGRLVFRFLAGTKDDANYDWIYLGRMEGHSPWPLLAMQAGPVFPVIAVTRGTVPMTENSPGVWAAHTPARIEWIRPPGLRAITFQYGIEDAAVARKESHSDGVEVIVEVRGPEGKVTRVFSRLLEPFNHPEQRGPQEALAVLPPAIAGQRLVLRVDPGPRGDPSFDWAWLSDIDVREDGPAIELPHRRRLAPDSCRELGGKPARYLPDDQWGAHAPAELVFTRPAALRQVTFHFGMLAGADRDESGAQRSDGIEVLAVFEPEHGDPVELFRRELDPYHRSGDLGGQTATIRLPANELGRLVFRTTPGPSGNNAFDWAYWGRFEGELSPEPNEMPGATTPPRHGNPGKNTAAP